MSENINREIYTELANRIYDLDAEVYRVLGSSLGRTFTGNRDTTIRTLSMLMYTKPDGHLLRSELALISNMARTIKEDVYKRQYCDNPMIMPEQFKDSYRPDYIIPFMKSKKEAKQALKAHYEGKPLLPKVFKDENHLEEIRAVYVPFWLFDLDTAGRFSYEATKTRVWEDDD